MRGFWRVLEAVVAGVVLISFLTVITATKIWLPETPSSNERAYAILEGLEKSGMLRNYTVALDTEGLNSEVSIYNYNHSVQICNLEGECNGTRPSAGTVWTGSYIIAGENNYTPYEVKLYLWVD